MLAPKTQKQADTSNKNTINQRKSLPVMLAPKTKRTNNETHYDNSRHPPSGPQPGLNQNEKRNILADDNDTSYLYLCHIISHTLTPARVCVFWFYRPPFVCVLYVQYASILYIQYASVLCVQYIVYHYTRYWYCYAILGTTSEKLSKPCIYP